MDVTCPRCQTDYEFDDALVSERGTTVKCTNCGHQFRVFRPRAGGAGAPTTGAAPELWRIERRQGESLELRSLVELQRAIRAGRVSREDLLRRGEGPSRRVGDIPELEPFFPTPRGDGAPNTLPLPSVANPLVTDAPRIPAHTPTYGGRTPSAPPAQLPGTMRPVAGVAPQRVNTDRLPASPRLPTPLGLGLPPPESIPSPEPQPPKKSAPPGPPPPRTPPPPMAPPLRTPPLGHEPEPPTIRRTDTARTASVPPPRTSAAVPSERPPQREESYDSLFPPPRKKSRAGWFVALLLIGGLVAAGATVGRPYLQKLAGGSPPVTSAPGSDRLTRELSAGDRAKGDGDWAGARDAYLRATVVDEKSLAAWDGLCTAESELAMAHWIAALAGHSALERDQASAIGASAATSCGRWSELARQEPEGAKKVSSDLRPVRAVAAQSDASGVRVYLPMHPGNPIVEALAYLADVPKGDDKALATATKNAHPALARADIAKLEAPADLALIAFGAGVAGNAARSQAALSELAKRAPRHVLLETLRGLTISASDAGVVDAAPHDAGAADAKPAAVAVGGGGGSGGGGGDETPGGDYRALNEKGHKALAGGDVGKAETYFKAALAQHPGDVDALYGLGQIARSRGEHAAAITYFQQVLSTSAGFSPARLALADEQWATGDKAAAAKNYELYLDRVSEGSGADRARSRLGKETGVKIEPKQDPSPKPEGKE